MSEHVQDLLLDLAYGELPPERVAEVEAHLTSCEACRTERDDIVRTRALVAPLRALEEPSARFDERIVQSARAEAGLQADGTPGQTIEVSGSVKPLGLHAGRVDPLGPGVRVAKKEISRRAVWWKRATLGASIAGAAAVALIVATSVQQKKVERAEEVPELKVHAPPVPSSLDARSKGGQETASAPQTPQPAARQGSGGDLGAVQQAAPPQRASSQPAHSLDAAKKADAPAQKPAAPEALSKDEAFQDGRKARILEQDAERPARSAAPQAQSAVPPAQSAPPPAPNAALPPAASAQAAPSDQLASAAPEMRSEAPASGAGEMERNRAPATAHAAGVPASRSDTGQAKEAAKSDADPDRLEESAGEARRSGNYPRAAELYRLAAGLRSGKDDSARAAWDLAHAVECLAAASKLDEAGSVRAELNRSYPSEQGPLRAADRALGYPAKTGR